VKIGEKLPRVSIIIAAYNAEGHIVRALESCNAQTYRNLEIFVVDDGSEDGTQDAVRAYQAKDERVKLLSVSNGGAGKARNLALDDCSGEFVTILDADDELHPHAVEKLVHDALANGSDVVSAEWVTVNKAKGVKSYGPHFGGRSYARLTQKQKRVLISKTHYAIGKLYLKTYLDRHAIRYGEGHIYEDQQFVVGSTVTRLQRQHCAPTMYHRGRSAMVAE
jgi:CDP-glycerol glycerophosphotransferase